MAVTGFWPIYKNLKATLDYADNVTFTVFSEFEPMKSENTIKSRFEKSITSDFTDLTDAILQNKMAEEYVCSTAGEED